jgi:large subunit ribosomal protein L18
MSKLKKQYTRRQLRTRKNLRQFHNNDKLRVSVYRSLKYVSAQVIDDKNAVTLFSITTKENEISKKNLNKVDSAYEAGMMLGKKLVDQEYKEIIFDRGGYLYHGRVKALADGIRAAGVQF